MAGMPILLLLLLLTLSVAAIVLLIQLVGRTEIAPGADDPLLRDGLQRIRRRLAGCLVAALLVLFGGVVLGTTQSAWLGIPAMLAPGLATSLALLGFAAWPVAASAGTGPVSATLTRREAWSYGSRRLFAAPATLAVIYLGLLAVSAAVASPDDDGLMRAFAQTQGDLSASATPFPGSYYGVPLAVVTVLLAVSTYAALRRLASSPTISPGTAEDLARIDQQWRRIATRVIVRISSTALLGYVGATLLYAGSAIHRTSDFTDNGGQSTPWSAVGWIGAGAGLVCLLLAIVVGGAAVAAVLTLRDQAVRPQQVAAGRPR